MDMTKTAVKAALRIRTDQQLADVFGITAQAVNQWPDDRPIPDGRKWELVARFPRKFGKAGGSTAGAGA